MSMNIKEGVQLRELERRVVELERLIKELQEQLNARPRQATRRD
jgi:TolA-binding protein